MSQIETKNSNIVVITAPHARCEGVKEYHQCNCADQTMIACIEKTLVDNVCTKTFVSTTFSKDCDLNGKWNWCSDSTFRKELRQYLNDNRKDIKFVLDVHSYPPEGEDDWGKYDVIILEDAITPPQYTVRLYQQLNKGGIKTNVVRGRTNPIQDEAREMDFPSLLLECNEYLMDARYSRRKEYVCTIVSNWLKAIK